MGNNYFKFKQFTVFHDKCAMKVGTDGVLLGAWANIADAQSILDVGCGSGLISLMCAQRNPRAEITAIDLDEGAVQQTKQNVAESVFKDSIRCRRIAVQQFAKNTNLRFDAIVCNPPFFVNSLKSPQRSRTVARHSDVLPIEELLEACKTLLSPMGRLSLILPLENEMHLMQYLAECGFVLSRKTIVYPLIHKPAKRVLLELVLTDIFSVEEKSLVIETERHVYTSDFLALVKCFYLSV